MEAATRGSVDPQLETGYEGPRPDEATGEGDQSPDWLQDAVLDDSAPGHIVDADVEDDEEGEEDEFLEPTPDGGLVGGEGQRSKADAIRGNDALARMLTDEIPSMPTEEFYLTRLSWTVTLRGLEDSELEAIQRRSLRKPNRSERDRGQDEPVRDGTKVNRLTVITGMVAPDLNDNRIIAKYGTAEKAAQAWFLPGEIIRMADAIADLSGWADDSLEKAKKS
jgi:hypothetical protein